MKKLKKVIWNVVGGVGRISLYIPKSSKILGFAHCNCIWKEGVGFTLRPNNMTYSGLSCELNAIYSG